MPWVLHGDRFEWQGMPGLIAFTTTRRCGVPAGPVELAAVRGAIERGGGVTPAAVVAMEQVHGDAVTIVADAVAADALLPACDAVATNRPGLALTMRSADCLPIVAFDPTHRAIGLAHAGWRGLKAQLPAQLISTMRSTWGCRDLAIGIGPAVGPCCYPVGPEFDEWFPKYLIVRAGQRYLDLARAALWQLVGAGIPKGRIAVTGGCTACSLKEHAFSYRREGEHAGRMVTCVLLQPSEGPCQENIQL